MPTNTPTQMPTDTPTEIPTDTPSVTPTEVVYTVQPLSACWVQHVAGIEETEWRITNPNPLPLASSPDVRVGYNWTVFSEANVGGSIVASATGLEANGVVPLTTGFGQSIRVEWYLVIDGVPFTILGTVTANADETGLCAA
jgi:hypothetical protein